MNRWGRLAVFGAWLLVPQLGAQSVTPEQLVGTWQRGFADIAAGFGDLYRFSPDGRFTFAFNQMDCGKREVSFSGQWSVDSGRLVLRIADREEMVGGRFEPATGSCATEKELVGARLRKRALNPPELLRIGIGPLETVRTDLRGGITSDGQLIQRLIIGGHDFWRLSTNPTAQSRDP